MPTNAANNQGRLAQTSPLFQIGAQVTVEVGVHHLALSRRCPLRGMTYYSES